MTHGDWAVVLTGLAALLLLVGGVVLRIQMRRERERAQRKS